MRGRIDTLRDLSHIAAFSRGLQRGAESGPPAAPERWGDLLLLERIGSGAHADVYRAWDPRLQREVALKLIRPGSGAESEWLEEGRAAARVRHPHVVAVHGIDRHDGRVGLWMELVRGVTLERRVQEHGPLDPAEAVRLGTEIGSALTAVHAAGTLHRDVKPANVVRDDEGRHVLTDFGLGLRRDRGTAPAAPTGTPMYMAPELLAGSPATERSDVYSLGMTLWFALAGRHPFEATTLPELIEAARRGPRLLRSVRAGIPARLAAVVERAIAPAPEARFAGPREMVEALGVATPEGWRAHPHAVAAVGGALLALLAAFVLWRSTSRVVDAPPPPALSAATYSVEASFLRRDASGATRLVTGDRVRPGDRLSLELHASRPAWVYVLNEDERGERYLLFPQPRFDLQNPLPADRALVLPGPIDGRENAWTVTSAGGREYFLVVASPEPVAELEADLGRLPAPRPGRPVDYARVGEAAVERLRGVGGVTPLPPETAPPVPRSRAFDRFRALAGRETGITGTWVRQIVLENPP